MTSLLRRCRSALHHAAAVLAVMAAGFIAPGAAFALPLPFSGVGAIQVQGDNGLLPPDLRLSLGLSDTSYTVGGDAGWTFEIIDWLYDPVTGKGGGDFRFSSALGTIFGSGEQQALTLELTNPPGPFFGVPLTLAHRYVATGGTGQYQGFQAVATSRVTREIGTPFFEEQGQFVPAPATVLLAAAALLALLAARPRRT